VKTRFLMHYVHNPYAPRAQVSSSLMHVVHNKPLTNALRAQVRALFRASLMHDVHTLKDIPGRTIYFPGGGGGCRLQILACEHGGQFRKCENRRRPWGKERGALAWNADLTIGAFRNWRPAQAASTMTDDLYEVGTTERAEVPLRLGRTFE